MPSSVPSIKFHNGYEYPILGLGTWKSTPGQVTEAVKAAIDIGYRHIDCAHVYGNEKEVGEAIREKVNAGVVKREDLFVTSKLWCTDHRESLVVPALKVTLANLGLEYLDLYLVHWPFGFKEGANLFPVENGKIVPSDIHFTETWRGMEQCSELGLARSIGISNFNQRQIEELLKVAKLKPVNNQIECHPYLNQQRLIDFCWEKDISVTAYSPLGSPDRPMANPNDPILLDEPKLIEIAEKYKKTPAQILIKYQIQRGLPVIPKSVTPSRIQSNFEVFDFSISEDDIAVLNSLDQSARMVKFDLCDLHEEYPFKEDY